MRTKIKDESGRIYPGLKEAFLANGLSSPGGFFYRELEAKGSCRSKGHTFTAIREVVSEPHQTGTAKEDARWEKIKANFSDQEIDAIAKGQGISQAPRIYPEVHLEGTHHRLLVMSDTHIGSKYSPKEWHDVVAEYANTHDIEAILHCGDLVEGLTPRRIGTQIYELSDLGYEAQKAEAIRLMSKYNPPIYIISGNHDRFFYENAGADIVQAVCDAVPNMTKIGDDMADFTIDGCKIRLFHGGDGSPYTLSYSLQRIIENINGGDKPNIFIRGHIHKYITFFNRNIHAISCPSLQAQTKWMQGKRLEAHVGFLVLDFETNNGQVANLAVTYFPFYA